MIEDDDIRIAEEQEEKKKKGDGTETGSMTRAEASVSEAFFETMSRFGASKELIAEVLRNWRHFKGQGLLSKLVDFARGLVKSSHVQVEIDRGKDYGVVHNFIQNTKTAAAPQAKVQKTHSNKPAAHSPELDLTLKPKL